VITTSHRRPGSFARTPIRLQTAFSIAVLKRALVHISIPFEIHLAAALERKYTNPYSLPFIFGIACRSSRLNFSRANGRHAGHLLLLLVSFLCRSVVCPRTTFCTFIRLILCVCFYLRTYSNRYNCNSVDATSTSAISLMTVIEVPALLNGYASIVKINL
jgi:hypothetical protein